MAKKGVTVGVEITGTAKGFKSASEDAARATAELKKKANAHAREIEQNFKQITIVMAKVAGAVIVAQKAFETYASVMKSTGGTADDFEKTIGGIEQGFDAIKRAVATLDFKDFIKNVKAAIDEGRRYAESLDNIDEETRALKMAESDANDEIIKQKLIQNSALSTNKQKIAAGKEIIRQEEIITGIRTGIANQAYQNEIKNIASITHLTNEEVEAYLRGEQAIEDKIEAGKKINEEITTREKLRVITLQNIKLTEQESKQYRELLAKQKEGYSLEEQRLAYAASRIAIDEKLNLAVQKYIELGDARRSGDENTLRVHTKLDSVYDKEADSLKKLTEAIKQNAEPIERAFVPKGIFPGDINALRPAPEVKLFDEEELTGQIEIVNELQDAFESLFSNASEGADSMAKAFVNAIKMIAVEMAAKAAMFAIFYAITGGTGKLFTGITGGKTFWQFLGATKMAEGGIAYSPTLVNVGEYANARTNPEIVAPLSNLKGLLGSQTILIKVQGKIAGRDIYLSAERYAELLNKST